MSQPIIQIQHLNKTFGTGPTAVHALEDINLEIEAGEIFGIIGLSGAGKSTLVRCMNLLERPTTGSVLVDGKDLTKLRDKQLRQARQDISMIFQSFNLLMQRTALDNICFPLELIGTKRADAVKRARELLELVGLGNRADAYPAQLSGGQKQRVAIARALATNPKVLLCDEATSALDPTTTLSILALLKELNETLGVTVVVITHQMNVIEEVCHRVAILDHGVVAEEGTVAEIFSQPKTDIGRQLVYPNGVQIDRLPPSRVIRVAFNGGSSYEPLIASLAIDCGVKVNILGADTRNIEGKAFGTMLNRVLGWIINVGRSLPFIILMIAIMDFTKLIVGTKMGVPGAIVPLVVSAAPFIARMVETSLAEVDAGVVEAAQSMGASRLQIVWKVYLPEAVPSLILGASISIITILGYTAIAGAMGAGGLGDLAIRYGYQRRVPEMMWVTVIFIIVLVQIIQSLFSWLSTKLDKRLR